MQLTLPAETVLKTGLLTAITLPKGAQIVALRAGQAPTGPIVPGVQLVDVPMNNWGDYAFSPNLKVRIPGTGQVCFLDRSTVIDYWFSPLVNGTEAYKYCTFQLSYINSGAFEHDFRERMLVALKSGRHSIRDLLGFFAAFNQHAPHLRRATGTEAFRRFEGFPIILYRFYTGEQHGLLPNILTGRYPVTGRLDAMTLLGEVAPLPSSSSSTVYDSDIMGGRSGSTSTYGSSAHGQGFTQGSTFVSTGPSLPNLLVSTSAKLQAILHGKLIFPEQVRRAIATDRASHLGVFFVPGSMWRCEFTGYESRQEREIVYYGFGDSGYEGLWDYELFTLRNPFGHHYGAPRPNMKNFWLLG